MLAVDIGAMFWSIPKARKMLNGVVIMPKPASPHSLSRKESKVRAAVRFNGVNLHENKPNVKYVDHRLSSD